MSRKKRIILKRSVSFIITMMCLLHSASAVVVVRREQEQSKWCWAACAQMMGHTVTGKLYSQSNICQYVKGAIANVSANVIELQDALFLTTGRSSSLYYNPISWNSAYNEVKSDPFTIRIGWNSGGGHFVVVSSAIYSTDPTLDNALTVVDPAVGKSMKMFNYDAMTTGTTFQSGTGKWTHTLTV